MAIESPPLAAKEAALERVLASQVLARAPQLRGFLKYVCLAEMAGRGAALNEYLVGVEGLGRPQQFSPTEDAIVRNRAHALRQRLDEYYRVEGGADPVRIELPRGSYCPRFVAQPAVAATIALPPAPPTPADAPGGGAGVTPAAALVAASPATPVDSLPGTRQVVPPSRMSEPVVDVPASAASRRRDTGRRAGRLAPLWPALVGAVVGAALASLWFAGEPRTRAFGGPGSPARWVSMFWGPLLGPHADVLVCVAAPAQVMLRAIEGPPPDRMWAPIPHLEQWFRESSPSPVSSTARVYLYPYWSSPFWGDAVGAMTLVPVLARAGVSYTTMPERVVTLPATRGRNLVVVGNPELSLLARHYLGSTPYTIAYDAAQREWGIVPTDAHPRGRAGPRFFLESGSNGISRTYGLITMVPSEGTVAQEKRTLLISGLSSSGTQAAAEFVASDAELAILADHLRRDGHPYPPGAYQVLVEATTTKSLPLTVRYHSHIVFSR